MNEGKVTPQQVSMAKRNACEVATNICRDAGRCLVVWELQASTLLCAT